MLLSLLLACGHPLDSGDSDSGATAGWDFDDEAWLYGDRTLDFDIELDQAALDALAAAPKDNVHATFSWEGESYDVGLHLKGSEAGSFRDLSKKASFKIDFHEWNPDQRFHDVKRLTLNNMIQDGTMSHEHTVYWLMRDLGVPAPRHGYARVTVNGELFGLYSLPESMDEQFINQGFPEDDAGNLYEGGYGGDLKSGREANFTLQEGDETTTADLTELIAAVQAAPANGALPMIQANFEADDLFHQWAVELVAADIDGYSTAANNFLIYHAPIAGRWSMIPWGPDQALETDQGLYIEESSFGGSIGELTRRCHADAACMDALDAAITDVLTSWEGGAFYDFVDTETARIEADCRADPRSEWGDYGCRDAQAALRDWVRARPAKVRAELGQHD